LRNYNQKIDEKNLAGSNQTYNILGILLLWVSWLAFNGGSSIATIGDGGTKAMRSLANTSLAPMMGGLVGCFLKKYITR
jgi:ammonia channel protein AmtB